MRDEIQRLRVLGPALLTIVSGQFSLVTEVVDVVFGVEEAVYVYYIVLCISRELRIWVRKRGKSVFFFFVKTHSIYDH